MTKTYKTHKTFLYPHLNLATARFKPAFRLFPSNIFHLGSKSILLPIFIMPTTHHQDYLEFNIKLRLYASYHDYGENAKGCSINLMIGASLVKKLLKIK